MFFVPLSSRCQIQDLHFRQWRQLSSLIMCRIIKGQEETLKPPVFWHGGGVCQPSEKL